MAPPQWANLAAFGNTEGVANNDGQWCLAPWCNYFQHCSGISTMDSIFELLEEVSRGALSVMMGDGVAQGPLVARLTCMKVQSFLETCCCLSRGFASGWVVQDGLGRCQWLMCITSWPVGISESEHMKGKVLTSTLLFADDCHKNIKKDSSSTTLHMNPNSYQILMYIVFFFFASLISSCTAAITNNNDISWRRKMTSVYPAWSCNCACIDLYQHTTLVIP